MTNTLLLKTLEIALNRYLALDPESSQRLQRLHGKKIAVELQGINLCFQLFIQEGHIHMTASDSRPAAMTLRGTPINLVTLALCSNKKYYFSNHTVSMEGDAELGQQVVNLFDALEIDWEEYLSHFIGDLPAYHCGRWARKLLAWGKEATASLTHTLNDYIHEEKPWFPPVEALQDFFHDVDDLRLDLDRLEARVVELQKGGPC